MADGSRERDIYYRGFVCSYIALWQLLDWQSVNSRLLGNFNTIGIGRYDVNVIRTYTNNYCLL